MVIIICVNEGGQWRNFINITLSVGYSNLEHKNNRESYLFHVLIIIMDFDVFTSEFRKTFKLINWQTDKYSSFHFDIDSIFIHSNDMNLLVPTCKITHYKFITNIVCQSIVRERVYRPITNLSSNHALYTYAKAYNGTRHMAHLAIHTIISHYLNRIIIIHD